MKWLDEMSKKQSLRFYIKEKMEVKYDMCYRNSISSSYYARARINSLKLEEQIGRGKVNYNKTCKLCEEEEEDIIHFTIKCEKLEQKRNYNLLDKKIDDPEERMRVLLFRNENRQEVSRMIKGMWDTRGLLLKERERNRKNKNTHKAQKYTEIEEKGKQDKKNRKGIQLKVVKDQNIKKIEDIMNIVQKGRKIYQKTKVKSKVQLKVVRDQDIKKILDIEKMVQAEKNIQVEKKGKQKEMNKRSVQLKAVRDQEIIKIQDIKRNELEKEKERKKEKNKNSIQLKIINDQDIKKIIDIKRNKQVEEKAKQTKKKKNKNIIQIKVVKDQDVKKMQDIEEKKSRR